tara:strand:- start:6 stop:182 length:177 start_codon:yes stop_codon:yes gene_type:complete
MTREELRQELMEDSTEYCHYCGGEKTTFQCCGEVHFGTFAQMAAYEQEDFLDYEEDNP